MSFEQKLVVLVLVFLGICFGDLQNDQESTSAVTELTLETFDSHIQQFKYTFVEFYAPWCGVCQKFTPEFENAASTFKKYQVTGIESPISVSFAKIDAWNETHINITSRFSVSGYPTCILFIDGVAVYKYDGDHSAQSVIDKVSRKIRPDIITVKSVEEIEQLKSLDRVVVIGLFENQQSEEWNLFSSVAQKHKEQYMFAALVVEDEATKTKLNEWYLVSKFPTMILFKSYQEGLWKLAYTGMPEEQISQWVESHMFPLLGDINKANSQLYIQSKIPLAFVFVENEDQKASLTEQLHLVATGTKLRLNFVFVDWAQYGSQAAKFGLSGNKVPCLAIENTTSKFHYAFNESLDITEENVSPWVTSFLEGTLQPSWRSQPVSLTNTSDVVIQVVASNYEELVLNNPKDVFIEYYAPWCGHCQALEPVWKEVAEFVLKKNKKYGGVVFAKMDATENDIPSVNDTVNSYPTIRLFKAGDKSNPVTFTRTDRSAVALLQFVQDNASQPHKLKKIVKKYLKKQEKKEKKVAKLWQFDDDDSDNEKEFEDELHEYHEESLEEHTKEL